MALLSSIDVALLLQPTSVPRTITLSRRSNALPNAHRITAISSLSTNAQLFSFNALVRLTQPEDINVARIGSLLISVNDVAWVTADGHLERVEYDALVAD